MQGLMMDGPLMISSIISHAARWHGDTEVVTRTVEGPIHRYGYRDAAARAAQLAHALRALGVEQGSGERIGTLAWNTYRHFELYYGVSGIGAVVHTINPRLSPAQLAYVINHAGDRFLFVDLTFVPLLEAIAALLPAVRGYIILTDAAHMPATTLTNAWCYETLIAAQPAEIAWPMFDEYAAAGLCYTSGTTGEPKGVLYSHRSTLLHAFGASVAEAGRRNDSTATFMPIVPMFHVNAWGLPYCAPMMGSRLVLCGAAHDAASLYELLEDEGVTTGAAIPAIWIRLLAYMIETGRTLTSLRALRVGGSAAPPSMIAAYESRGIEVIHGWGMTETSPVCTSGSLKREHRDSPNRLAYQMKAGRCLFGVEMKIIDENGRRLPDDGTSAGELCVRGPWVASAYFDAPDASAGAFTPDGWFRTGDICTLDPDGYLTIMDRAKDLIKSGGEWISSIELENVAVAHPEILEAAAIAIPHPQWSERPLLIVRRRDGSTVDREDILAFLATKVPKFWLPDEIAFTAEMPYTATGKISKLTLRRKFTSSAAT
jgi:acyl-CoA synthetase (AMP-forming)/AMP-acid ligase II